MTEAETAVREALAKMTPGEWAHHTNALGGAIGQGAEWIRAFDEGGSWVIASLDFGTDESPSEQQIADAAGIVALKNHTPALLTELDAVRGRAEALANPRCVDQHGNNIGNGSQADVIEAFVDEHGAVWMPPPGHAYYAACKALETQGAELAAARAEVADLKASVIAFAGPWSGQYARLHDLPAGHLHPTHYDILAKCGARMDDFTRAALEPRP